MLVSHQSPVPSKEEAIVKIRIALIATAGVLALALAGCSGGGGSSTSGTATTAPKQNGSSSSKGYSADDLVAILKKAQTTLNAGGTIKDNAQLEAALAKLGNASTSITGALTKAGGKISPASCGTFLDNAVPDAKKFTASGGVEASLNYSKGDLGLLANPNGALPANLTSGILTDLDGMYSTCGDMTVTDGSVVVSLKVTKVAATTTADRTYAYAETIDVSGQKSTIVAIEAIYGNLFITMNGLGGTQADAEAAINAVVAAAKG
jgi:hypothetical protein